MTESTGPSVIDCRRYGDTLARAIHAVRSSGTTVAPFKNGLFRVGDGAATHTCSAAEIHSMAAKVKGPKREAPRTSERPAIPVPAGGREGTPVASRVGVSPVTPPIASPPPDDAPQADPPTCNENSHVGPDLCGCGRPKPHGGRCWVKRGQAGPPGPRVYPKNNHTSRITALERELAAVKAKHAAFEEKVKAAVADLVAHLGLGQGQ